MTSAAGGEEVSGPRYLADKGALARLGRPEVGAVLEPLILAGEVATCASSSWRSSTARGVHADLVRTRATRVLAFPLVDMAQADFDRAADVMEALAQRGQHRAVGLPDLLIAAVAERAGLTVLHYDADYELVAGHRPADAVGRAPRHCPVVASGWGAFAWPAAAQ